ncbi:microtubule-associated protein futsch-like [Lineus longissimus]|uniref:microtubule-associated protein futsch-like n=1 Tax=Lineus longissimus TaxID=88925 RepID=UPI002B4D625E
MGNGASSNNNVKPITSTREDKRPENNNVERPSSTSSGIQNARLRDTEVKELTRKLAKSEELRTKAEEEAEKAKEDVAQLEMQVSDLESTILDLKDQIQLLEERLDQAYRKNVITEEKGCEETLQIKDQYIKKLEDETKKVQNEIAKLKMRSKKKLHAANTQLAEAKQHSSLKMFEMKDEIARLAEENKKLSEQTSGPSQIRTSDCGLSNSGSDDGRTRIILQLSQQISEQNTKITALERSMGEKDSTIKGLTIERGNTSLSHGEQETINGSRKVSPRSPRSPRDLHKMGTFLTEESQSDSGSLGGSPSELLLGTADSQTLFHRVSGEMDELQAIAREMSDLQKKKKKQKRAKKPADLKGVETVVSNGLPPIEKGSSASEAERRQWSSTSRDSGYGRDTKNSAGGSARRRRRERFTERLNSAGRQISATSQISSVTDSDILLDSKTGRVGSAKSYLSDLSEYNADNSEFVDYMEFTDPLAPMKT